MSRPASGDDEVLANTRETRRSNPNGGATASGASSCVAAELWLELGRYGASYRYVAGLSVSVAVVPTIHARTTRRSR